MAVRVDDDDVVDAAYVVAKAMARYAEAYGVTIELRDAPPEDPNHAGSVWAPRAGWTLVSGPRFFTGNAAAGQWLSGQFHTLVSTIDVYDGDLWMHLLWRDGVELDRFNSCPDYFVSGGREARRLRDQWAGRPEVVAAAFGRPVEHVAPYLVHPYSSRLFGRRLPHRKAFPDDEHRLGDFAVFVDFWRRMGIAWATSEKPARHLFIDKPDKLPTGPSV